MRLGLGIAAGPDPGHLAALAREAEDLGYDSMWTNDHPAGDGLAQLSAWAGRSERIRLCVGVLALDRHDPRVIAERLRELDLPLDRLLVGLGSGFTDRPLKVMREGVAALREANPQVHIAVAAMGPMMCALGGEVGDAVLLNWMTPERAAWARPQVLQGAQRAGRTADDITIYGYVRTALGQDAGERLEREASIYLQMPAYARHFEAMGGEPADAGVASVDGGQVAASLLRHSDMDEPVVRVLSDRELADILAVARAAIGA
jgi:alkanesulfonate monooxygenase SsuD/methylene tetrahydromethanopterin reductase-like flavin-dependent oxidoreductase (luciferase family)